MQNKNPSQPSRIGIGCWSFGGGSYWGSQSQQDVNEVVHAALDAGVNFFDTARLYNDGASEQSLGEALKGVRDRALVASKVSPAKSYYHELIQECDRSLMNLKADYLDLYMIHWPFCPLSLRHFTDDPHVLADPPTAEEAFSALKDLKKAGKIRSIGVSNFGPKQLTEALSLCPEIEYNELTYNIISRAIEAEIVPLCEKNGVQILSSMTLQQGILAGKYQCAQDVPPNQAHSRHFSSERGAGTSRHGEAGAEKEIFEVLEVLKNLSKKLNLSVSQLAIAWVLKKKFIGSALIGCRNTRQLADNLAAAAVSLPDEIEEMIDRISLPVWEKLGNSADYYENRANSRIF